MTKQETSERNWGIARLRGSLPHIGRLLPDELKDRYYTQLQDLSNSILDDLGTLALKVFTCKKCSDTSHLHKTKNKKAYKCDLCNLYTEDLYLIKRPKCH